MEKNKQMWPVHLNKWHVWSTGGLGREHNDVFYVEVEASDREEALEKGQQIYTSGDNSKAVELASPPNGARDHSEARLGESKDELLCIKCGKRKRYERNGRVFNLCVVCGWNNIQEFLDLPDHPAELRNEAEPDGTPAAICASCVHFKTECRGIQNGCPDWEPLP